MISSRQAWGPPCREPHRGAGAGRHPWWGAALLCAVLLGSTLIGAQQQPAAQTAPSAREAAPIDLTGYWVSIVTEDWRWRMVTPPKGDYSSVPLNEAGRQMADTWDPAKDEADGEACRPYGAAAVMRIPGRLHISWDGDNTLKIDTEAGTQTRLLKFGAPQSSGGDATWQGSSVARWEIPGGRLRRGAAPPPGGSLQVQTTRMRPGYLRKNGVPYSSNAVLTEHFSRTVEENGDSWLIVTTIVQDPQYLNQRFITSTHFKKLPDGSGWNPTPCRST
jgi:hypothetical protein